MNGHDKIDEVAQDMQRKARGCADYRQAKHCDRCDELLGGELFARVVPVQVGCGVHWQDVDGRVAHE